MKLKIVSDGTPSSTRVLDAETGEVVEDIINLEISMTPFSTEAAILLRCPVLSLDNIDTLEVKQGDSTGDDGRASPSDNQ